MSYFTILENSNSIFVVKKSEFIGNIARVSTEDKAKEFINDIKTKHRDATHNVYAYIIGEDKNIQRFSDDGEPQGTAGIPILDVLKSNNLTDIVVVSTRYFGGVLLGASGLIRAYVKSATLAIQNSKIVEIVEGCLIKFIFNYDLFGKIQHVSNEKKWDVKNITYEDKVSLDISCELKEKDKIINELVNITNNNIQFDVTENIQYFKDDLKYYYVDEF